MWLDADHDNAAVAWTPRKTADGHLQTQQSRRRQSKSVKLRIIDSNFSCHSTTGGRRRPAITQRVQQHTHTMDTNMWGKMAA